MDMPLQVGAVISNPEVQGLVPVLLGGIAHPDTKGRCAPWARVSCLCWLCCLCARRAAPARLASFGHITMTALSRSGTSADWSPQNQAVLRVRAEVF